MLPHSLGHISSSSSLINELQTAPPNSKQTGSSSHRFLVVVAPTVVGASVVECIVVAGEVEQIYSGPAPAGRLQTWHFPGQVFCMTVLKSPDSHMFLVYTPSQLQGSGPLQTGFRAVVVGVVPVVVVMLVAVVVVVVVVAVVVVVVVVVDLHSVVSMVASLNALYPLEPLDLIATLRPNTSSAAFSGVL